MVWKNFMPGGLTLSESTDRRLRVSKRESWQAPSHSQKHTVKFHLRAADLAHGRTLGLAVPFRRLGPVGGPGGNCDQNSGCADIAEQKGNPQT